MAGGGRVIQGAFAGGRPRLAGAMAPPAVAQRSPNGYALQMPESVLGRRSGGQPIPEPVRQKMETALGADFSDVRIHVGPEASAIGALAFAHGSDIYFATGQYNPASLHGQRLLGHELTHVVQQRAGRVRNPFGSGVAVVQDPGLEAEAERMGILAAAQPKMAAGAPRALAPHVQAAMATTGGARPLPAAGVQAKIAAPARSQVALPAPRGPQPPQSTQPREPRPP
ncbi:MAG: DUF4157 domain-containing protein, partial [Acidobacteriota bacterium]|nr:DUF4157 domain-containing protein [Acidobacteriota bacterium]